MLVLFRTEYVRFVFVFFLRADRSQAGKTPAAIARYKEKLARYEEDRRLHRRHVTSDEEEEEEEEEEKNVAPARSGTKRSAEEREADATVVGSDESSSSDS